MGLTVEDRYLRLPTWRRWRSSLSQ